MDMGAGTASDGHGPGTTGDSHSGMSSMAMVFNTNINTPLYGSVWAPSTPGAYAGTCIFLVVLAMIARVLLAVKARQEARWRDRETHRVYHSSGDAEARKTALSVSDNGVEETVVAVDHRRTAVQPWRLSVDPLRAVLDTVIVGVGYLLMLAVMTMNVGYFLSVLAGVFVGTLAVGRFIHSSPH
jgi:hypothetical protein